MYNINYLCIYALEGIVLLFKKNNTYKTVKYEYSNGKDRVFISYQRESYDFVLMLSEYLEKSGVKTWYAPRNIKLSGLWPDKLHEAIENCKCLLLLYTEYADKSKHVIREVAIADEYNKPVMWLKLDSTEPKSKILKYFLKLVQTIEYNNDTALLEKLRDILKEDVISFDELSKTVVINKESKLDITVEQWSKGIYAFETADEAAECAARVYFGVAKDHPDTTALLPTGRSAKRLFQAMIRLTASEYKKWPLADMYLMNDTETFGVKRNHPTSRVKTINDNLINILSAMNIAPDPSKLVFFGESNDEIEPEDVAKQNLIKYPPAVYGISISPYMEIIGYDIGTHKSDITNDGPRVIEVTDETKDYIDKRQKSHSIYTIGLKTALSAETLMILAFESNKSNAIERLFKENLDPDIPVTLLRQHKNAYVIITKEIAEKANVTELSIMNLSPEEAAECILQKK